MTSTLNDCRQRLSREIWPGKVKENDYWASYNKHIGPKVSGNGKTFMISVSLDSGIWEGCRGVRIMIARKADDDLGDVTIDTCLDKKAYPGDANLPPLSGRDILRRKKTAKLEYAEESSSREAASEEQKTVFTLVYELVKVNVYWIELFPVVCLKDRNNLAIVYDQTFPISTNSHSFIAMLESTVGLRRDPSLFPRRRCGCSRRSRPDFPSLVHSVRIQPPGDSDRKPWPVLPPNIIRSIALFLIQPTHEGWRRDLRSLGFISKAWTRVLDLFFKTYWGNRPMRDRPSAVAVANSLSFRPERAAAIRQLFLCHYSEADKLDSMDQAERSAVLAALVKILSLGKNVKRTEIIPMDHDMKYPYLDALFALRDVEYCTVLADFTCSRYGSSISADGYYRVGVDVMQGLVARWPKLSNLDYTGSDEGDDPPAYEIPPPVEGSYSNLKYLTLRRVHLTPSQFIRFLDAPSPRISTITLLRITGLTNHDVFLGLRKVAPTLTSISLTECDFPRATPDEEYALDAIMPDLTSLQSICVTGDCVDWLSVARKTPNEHITFGPSISIGRAPGFSLDKLPEALESSHWSTVSITSEAPMGPDALERARAVASDRGMNFWYWHEKPPSPPIFQAIVAQNP